VYDQLVDLKKEVLKLKEQLSKKDTEIESLKQEVASLKLAGAGAARSPPAGIGKEQADGWSAAAGKITPQPGVLMLSHSRQVFALNGRSWDKVPTSGVEPTWIAMSSGNIWVLGSDGSLNSTQSIDGSKWTSVKLEGQGSTIKQMDVSHDNSAVWAVDSTGKLFSGALSGQSVKLSNVSVPATAKRVVCAQNRIALLASDGSKLFLSNNKGESWTSVGSPTSGVVLDIDMRATGVLWCCTDDFSTWCHDGKWIKIYQGQPGSGATSLAVSPDRDTYWLVCPIGKIWQGPTTWHGATYMEAVMGGKMGPAGISGAIKVCSL